MAAKAQQLEYALDQFILQLESGDQSSNQVELFLQAADTVRGRSVYLNLFILSRSSIS